jgi:hypothetical protein
MFDNLIFAQLISEPHVYEIFIKYIRDFLIFLVDKLFYLTYLRLLGTCFLSTVMFLLRLMSHRHEVTGCTVVFSLTTRICRLTYK